MGQVQALAQESDDSRELTFLTLAVTLSGLINTKIAA